MKFFWILLAVLLLAGCASRLTEVDRAWHRYRSVKVGMTWQRVHAIVGEPEPQFTHGPHNELWRCPGEPESGSGAMLWVIYDGGLSGDERVMQLTRILQRPGSPRVIDEKP